jgi:hypothetical protein
MDTTVLTISKQEYLELENPVLKSLLHSIVYQDNSHAPEQFKGWFDYRDHSGKAIEIIPN